MKSLKSRPSTPGRRRGHSGIVHHAAAEQAAVHVKRLGDLDRMVADLDVRGIAVLGRIAWIMEPDGMLR